MEYTTLLGQFAETALKALLVLLVGLLIVGGNEARKWLVARYGEQQVKFLEQLARNAVMYAENSLKVHDNDAKFVRASNWFIDEAARFGIKLDDNQMKAYLEAALLLLKDAGVVGWTTAPRPRQSSLTIPVREIT